MPKIHPTALVSPEAHLAEDVEVGAYSIIEELVSIGPGTKIGEHVTIKGKTTIGEKNIIHKGTAIGEPAQDFTFDNWEGRIEIGDGNVFRENCTIHLPVQKENATKIGSGGFFMVNAHIAHDCVIGDQVILVNNCAIGGYSQVGDRAYISASVAVIQNVRIGAVSILGSVSKAARDVPPYVMATGTTAVAHGLNTVGLKRAGFSAEARKAIKEAFKLLYLSKLSIRKALDAIEQEIFPRYSGEALEKVQFFTQFIREAKRGIISYSDSQHEA